MEYKEQISHPKWQKKRLEILERDEFICQNCHDDKETLHIHHLEYHKNKMIWDYDNKYLITFCKTCHGDWHYIKDDINKILCVNLDTLKEIGLVLHELDNLNLYQIDRICKIIKMVKQIKG